MSPQIIWLSFAILSQFIICNGRTKSSSSHSSDCHCYTYSGDAENFNDDGTCKHCQSCSNGNCKCLSSEECQTTFTIVGIIIAVVVVCVISGCCLRRRRRMRMGLNNPIVIVEPATYNAPPTQSKQAIVVNSQNVQMVNGQPVIYVTQPVPVQQTQYITQPVQQPQYIVQQPLVQQPVLQQNVGVYPNLNNPNVNGTGAPPSYDTVAPSSPPH